MLVNVFLKEERSAIVNILTGGVYGKSRKRGKVFFSILLENRKNEFRFKLNASIVSVE